MIYRGVCTTMCFPACHAPGCEHYSKADAKKWEDPIRWVFDSAEQAHKAAQCVLFANIIEACESGSGPLTEGKKIIPGKFMAWAVPNDIHDRCRIEGIFHAFGGRQLTFDC